MLQILIDIFLVGVMGLGILSSIFWIKSKINNRRIK